MRPSLSAFTFSFLPSWVAIETSASVTGLPDGSTRNATFPPSTTGTRTARVEPIREREGLAGLIKAYDRAAWEEAWNTGAPIDFEAAGLPVVNLLSGAYLGFDRYNNLYVGGGDVFGSAPDSNYAAVVYRASLDDVFAGGGMNAREVETWGGTRGHKVTFGGIELDRFEDPGNAAGPNERYLGQVPRATYLTILAAGSTATLRVEVNLIGGGGSDDFILEAYGYRVTPRR